jgi:hypothetical protein
VSRRARATRSRHRCNHARFECPSGTLRRTLKRRSSSTYEASGFFSVTSASSAFSVPVTVICCSCRPTLLYGDGCGAAAVHSMCRGSCGQWSVNAQMTKGVRPTASSATAIPTRASARARCARACVRAETACSGGSMQHATRDGRHATCNMQHATRNMPRTTSMLRPCHVWQMTRDLCRAASCSATGAAQL